MWQNVEEGLLSGSCGPEEHLETQGTRANIFPLQTPVLSTSPDGLDLLLLGVGDLAGNSLSESGEVDRVARRHSGKSGSVGTALGPG